MASYEIFTSLTGQTYLYQICDVNGTWNAVPANYCFAKRVGLLHWTPLYFGETENLASRMPGHDKLTLAARHGATHILAHVNLGGAAARKAEERDLIRAYNPPCNIQHRSNAQGLLGTFPPAESPLAAALRRRKK